MTDGVRRRIEDLLRELAPQVLGTLTGRYGQFDACEDATQEALLKAARHWLEDGIPHSPRGWLLTVASRVLIDEFRSDSSRRRREDAVFAATPQSELLGRPADSIADQDETAADRDDSLKLLFLCCHPSLSVPSQIALTLRAVGGLTTAQIAAAFLVPEATMAQRISRAKATIGSGGIRFEMPEGEAHERLQAVQHVLYLIFNEGYAASSGEDLTATSLSDEAIRLTRLLRRLLPEDAETAGLLALMLLTDARRPARTTPDGTLVPLAEQDRTRWTSASIAEGVALISAALPRGPVGPYQLQAAIAAVHDEAPTMDDTDWPQILGLYDLLEKASPNPMTTLNRAVAVAMVHGAQAALALVASLESDGRMARNHRLLATRAHLKELAGDRDGAASDYRQAAQRTASVPERRHLTGRAAALDDWLQRANRLTILTIIAAGGGCQGAGPRAALPARASSRWLGRRRESPDWGEEQGARRGKRFRKAPRESGRATAPDGSAAAKELTASQAGLIGWPSQRSKRTRQGVHRSGQCREACCSRHDQRNHQRA